MTCLKRLFSVNNHKNGEKKALRKYFLEKRSKITDCSSKDYKIWARLINNPYIINADCILTYVSYNNEADTSALIDYLLSHGKPVYVPKCFENGKMDFYRIRSVNDLAVGKYGIKEPVGCEKPVITENTVCIVPALSFTAEGYRLGYGGGYYDRFLAENKQLFAIGICYDELISDTLPCSEYDINTDIVVTEERTVCNLAKG